MGDIAAQRPAAGAPIESAWGGQVHDAIEGIQSGKVTITGITSSTGVTVTVTFARAFSAPPVITVGSPSTQVGVGLLNITATTFQMRAVRWDGSSSAYTGEYFWLAIGTLA